VKFGPTILTARNKLGSQHWTSPAHTAHVNLSSPPLNLNPSPTRRRRSQRWRRRGRRAEEIKNASHGGPDPVGAVRLPEPAVLPGDDCRQPLPARRQAPRGPRLLQPAPRSFPFLSNSRPVDLLATGVRACFVHAGSRRFCCC
jgi:hypothetical protein